MWPEAVWLPELTKGALGVAAFCIVFRLARWRWLRETEEVGTQASDQGLD
jgi:hypothetical protein